MDRMSTDELLALIDEDDFDPDDRDTSKGLQTYLMRLCHLDIGEEDIMAILTKLDDKEADYTIRDSHGRTAIMHACIGNKPDVLQYLTARSDLTAMDNEGNTVLVHAIKSGELESVEYLLYCEGTAYELLGVRNNLGLTALDFAKRGQNAEIIRLIEDHMPVHPSVKHLRKRQDSKQAPLAPLATSGKPSNRNSRVPYYQSKSLDNCDHVTPVNYDRSLSAGCTRNNDGDDVPSGKQNGSHSFLPDIGSGSRSGSGKSTPVLDRVKCRRDSVSLPDLRDLSGILVSSGTTTPVSLNRSRLTMDSQESLDEDVFETEDSKSKNSSVKTLPVLLPKRSNLISRTCPTFSRSRKKSNSADDVFRSNIF